MSSFIDGVLIIGGSTVLALLGMYLVRRRVPRQSLESCHEVGGFMLAVVGTLYAIVVGLVVVSSQAKVDEASQMAVSEANMLSNIYHLAKTFREPERFKIRQSVHLYAVVAVDQDWAKVESGEEPEATIEPYRALWHEVTSYQPRESNETQCYATMLTNLEELSAARKFRLVAAKCGLSSVLWSVLIAGGVMVVLFTYFFFMESLLSQALMTAFVSIFISMNVYLIYVCQNPYRPELGVKKAGFGYSFNPSWFKEPPKPAEKPK